MPSTARAVALASGPPARELRPPQRRRAARLRHLDAARPSRASALRSRGAHVGRHRLAPTARSSSGGRGTATNACRCCLRSAQPWPPICKRDVRLRQTAAGKCSFAHGHRGPRSPLRQCRQLCRTPRSAPDWKKSGPATCVATPRPRCIEAALPSARSQRCSAVTTRKSPRSMSMSMGAPSAGSPEYGRGPEMSDLQRQLGDYVSLRRSLGYVTREADWLLRALSPTSKIAVLDRSPPSSPSPGRPRRVASSRSRESNASVWLEDLPCT